MQIHRFPLAVASRVWVGELFRFCSQLIKLGTVVNKQFKLFYTPPNSSHITEKQLLQDHRWLTEAWAEQAYRVLAREFPTTRKEGSTYQRNMYYISSHIQ